MPYLASTRGFSVGLWRWLMIVVCVGAAAPRVETAGRPATCCSREPARPGRGGDGYDPVRDHPAGASAPAPGAPPPPGGLAGYRDRPGRVPVGIWIARPVSRSAEPTAEPVRFAPATAALRVVGGNRSAVAAPRDGEGGYAFSPLALGDRRVGSAPDRRPVHQVRHHCHAAHRVRALGPRGAGAELLPRAVADRRPGHPAAGRAVAGRPPAPLARLGARRRARTAARHLWQILLAAGRRVGVADGRATRGGRGPSPGRWRPRCHRSPPSTGTSRRRSNRRSARSPDLPTMRAAPSP